MLASLKPHQKALIRDIVARCFFYSQAYKIAACREPNWRILTYHRIIDPEKQEIPTQPGMYVRPETFAEQMAFLARSSNVISLDELLDRIDQGQEIKPKTIIITFDDGWIDNYSAAYPILKQHGLAATIFLPTSFIGSKDCFWTEKVSRALNALSQATDFHERIRSLLANVCSEMPEVLQICSGLILGNLGNNRLEDFDLLIERLKLETSTRRRILVDKLTELSREFTGVKAERLFLNWEEVREMASNNITFGSHSHRHHDMRELSDAHLDDEITNSYQALKTNSVKPVGAFCYPGGYYNQQTQEALATKKIKFAITCQEQAILASALCPTLLGRTHVHQDICASLPLFALRVWGPKYLVTGQLFPAYFVARG